MFWIFSILIFIGFFFYYFIQIVGIIFFILAGITLIVSLFHGKLVLVIPKGWHKPIGIIQRLVFFKDYYCINRIYKFNKTCYYKHDNPEYDRDINKLFGLCFGLNSHKNSFRFGWRPLDENRISLFIYNYIDGERRTFDLFEVRMYEYIHFKIEVFKYPKKIRFTVIPENEDMQLEKIIRYNNYNWIGRTMGTYIGGESPAKHKMTIFKKEL